MAFREIEIVLPESNGELPWLKDYLIASPSINGTVFVVNTVHLGQKGVLIVTTHFKCFLFKSNPYYNFLKEALEVWVKKGIPVAALVWMVKKDSKTLGVLGIEDSLESSWEKKSEFLFSRNLGTQDFSFTPKESNPLLASTSPSNVSPKTQKGGKKRKAGDVEDAVGEAARSLSERFEDSELYDVP